MLRHAGWALAAVVASSAGPGASAGQAPSAVVLVTIDTLRADHLGCYGYERPTSPFLDRLAERSVLFEDAVSSIAHTAPAHASIFTGLYPLQHRVLRNGEGFAAREATGFGTLAELAESAGYATAAFSAVGFLRPIMRGFGTVEATGSPTAYTPADAVVDAALAWLERRRPGDPFLLWVHLYDPHAPDRAPEDLGAVFRFVSPRERAGFGQAMREARRIPVGTYRSDLFLAEAYNAYDAEVRFADRELGRLFDRMELSGRNDGAVWVVTADHGEGLGSHGARGHGISVHGELIRVPLIVYRDGHEAGTRVRGLARHVDLFPTIARSLGVSPDQPGYTLPGRSLWPRLDHPGGAPEPSTAFVQRRPADDAARTSWEPGEVYGVQDLDWKYVVHGSSPDELFDLRHDPLELTNVARDQTAVAERLGRLARTTYDQLLHEGRAATATPVDEDALPELRALGYVQ